MKLVMVASAAVLVVACAWTAVAATAAGHTATVVGHAAKARFKGTVNIGLISDYTGDLEVASDMQGAQSYINYVNAHGGIDGYKLVGKAFDAGSSPTMAVQAARSAIASHPAGIISASETIGSGLGALAQSGIPTVGDGFIGGYTGHKNVFPAGGDFATHVSDVYLVIAKKYAHATKIALIGSAINASVQAVVENDASQAGISFVYKNLTLPLVPTAPQLLSLAQQVKASGAQAIVDFGVEQLQQLQVDLNQLGAKVHAIGSVVEPGSTSANGTMYALPWATTFVKRDPGITDYNNAMIKYGYRKYLATDLYGPFRWTQVALMVQGLKAAGPPFNHAAVVDALRHVKNFSANGIIPAVSFPAAQNQGSHCDTAGEIINGKWTSLINGPNPFVCGGPAKKLG